MSRERRALLLRASAVLTLLSSSLIVYSMLVPEPLTVVIAMSIGQGVGILGALGYLYVVGREILEGRPSVPPGPSKETSRR